MAITFHYKQVNRDNGTSGVSPSIPVNLTGPAESMDVMAVLDSGADFTACGKDVAEILGLDLSGPAHPTFGVGGKVNAVRSNVNVSISKAHETYAFDIPIIVILEDCDFGILLGRATFFDKFKITFDQDLKKIILKRNNK